MQYTVALALLASVVAAFPGNSPGGYGSSSKTTSSAKMTTSCKTESTCKAVYTTYPEVEKTSKVVTVTTTVYKPETITTQVPSTYQVTVPSEYHT